MISVFVYVSHTSKTTLSDFSDFSEHVTYGRGSERYVLRSVWWMASCFHINNGADGGESLQQLLTAVWCMDITLQWYWLRSVLSDGRRQD